MSISLLKKKAKRLKLNKIRRHIFLCCDQRKANCCSHEEGAESWIFLKNILKETNSQKEGLIFRTKADCLQLCQSGPIAVVYPEGTWYHSCTPKALKKIVNEHLLKGNIVKENLICVNQSE